MKSIYQFDVLRARGAAVARLLGMEEAGGSNPPGSIQSSVPVYPHKRSVCCSIAPSSSGQGCQALDLETPVRTVTLTNERRENPGGAILFSSHY